MISVALFNEYFIYYLWFSKCSWPVTDKTKALILADVHLLGIYRGHWLDKLRREWQMYRSFQTAVGMFNPDVVFILGDLFDEGEFGSDAVFNSYVDRFRSLFYVPGGTKLFTVPGNHDIGFHYSARPQNVNRYIKAFGNEKGVEHVEVDGNHFILINSVAMEGDGCRFCETATNELNEVSDMLNCSMRRNSSCTTKTMTPYSRPILMQHYPLYRTSDQECSPETPDLGPQDVVSEKFRERWDCLSSEATKFLLEKFRPRAAFSGHVHFGCKKWWGAPYNLWEFTVPSFSWRNLKTPSFILASISSDSLDVSTCFVPNEHYTYIVYGLAGVFFIVYVLACELNNFRRFREPKYRKLN
ncbi:unnamed protein product [Bursaphelenchus okinawaensis]|uniref:Calcineurin-like phosphoesterase domain-containing protein n=1 Tax=Bursaphelenchus okinawaensis TaxID=465554 RepID=A0A811JSB4_9BILA|nr:unnamed protein product [Bursaphelenchus okinawaensis]CAG9080928.1 unnamed protein product [Bursaphelenchus okinawaensis]